jgi:short-subunit dehydrogenase
MNKNHNIDTTIVCPYAINTGMFKGFLPKLGTFFRMLDETEVGEAIYEGILTK